MKSQTQSVKGCDVPRFKLTLIRNSMLYIMASMSNNNYNKASRDAHITLSVTLTRVYILAPYTMHLPVE